MGDFQTIELERRDTVARVWLNRPKIHNAINAAMIDEVTGAFKDLSSDGDVRVVVLSGRGKSFCVGADLNWMVEKGGLSEEENVEDSMRLAGMLRAVYDCAKPTIARVQGLTIGGGNGLVAACDLAVASDRAEFRIAETKLGIVPAVISPYLFRRLGDRNCREIFLTAKQFGAAAAGEFGLLNRVVPHDELDGAVKEWITDILQNGPCALVAAKELLKNVSIMSLDEAMPYTARMIARLRSSPEGREGMAAFFEKRRPSWAEKWGD
jgi:methylglutaconyl-CoA hydratase